MTERLINIGYISLFVLMLLSGIYFYGYHQGEQKATEKYLPQITKLKDAIDTADKEAKSKQQEYQENANETQRQNNQRIDDIRNYYKRLLQPMPSKAGSISSTSGSQATDGTSCQSTLTGCPASIEENCALDANKVRSWQEWAVKNKIPISVD